MTTTPFLNRAQRSVLIDEFVECMYEIDENYSEDQERADREWLSRLNNNKFVTAIVDQMPDALMFV